MPRGPILIVQQAANESDVLRLSLNWLHLEVATADGTGAALNILGQERFHAIIARLGATDRGAKAILRFLQSRETETPVDIMADRGNISVAEEYHAAEAFDFMLLPIDR